MGVDELMLEEGDLVPGCWERQLGEWRTHLKMRQDNVQMSVYPAILMYTSSHTREVSYKSTFYSGKNTIIMITTTMITFIIISVFVVAALRCLSAVDGTLKSNN